MNKATSKTKLVGRFHVQVFDKDGKLKYDFHAKNTIVTVGKNKLFDIGFGATAKMANWYIGLMDHTSFSSINAADTMASHAGWIEHVAYTESVRQTWVVDAASAGSIANGTTVATFTINATGVLHGAFVTSDNTKSGTTGTLWAAIAFGSTVSVVNGDSIKITYTVSA